MAVEARTFREGTLRWVQGGSGTGAAIATGWLTGASPVSGLLGFVRVGTNFERGWNYTPVYDRGRPSHQKMTQQNMVDVEFTVLVAVTADWTPQNPAITASGFSTPQWHYELKMHDVELAGKDVPFAGTGLYYQFYNSTLQSVRFGEAEDGNTLMWKIRALAVNGPTGSGYLS